MVPYMVGFRLLSCQEKQFNVEKVTEISVRKREFSKNTAASKG
tara:strand:+ start:144 stop:272 length:129 start_codon:yes stop_codon:yes gene_type:complete